MKQKHVKTKSVRREKFDQGIRAGKSARRAALDAGYSEHTANREASQMARPVIASMVAALDRQGITDDFLAGKLHKLLGSKDEGILLRATDMGIHIRDGYPAPKEKVEDSRPITIVLPGNLREMMPPAKS